MEFQHINSHWTGFETRWTCSIVLLFSFLFCIHFETIGLLSGIRQTRNIFPIHNTIQAKDRDEFQYEFRRFVCFKHRSMGNYVVLLNKKTTNNQDQTEGDSVWIEDDCEHGGKERCTFLFPLFYFLAIDGQSSSICLVTSHTQHEVFDMADAEQKSIRNAIACISFSNSIRITIRSRFGLVWFRNGEDSALIQ